MEHLGALERLADYVVVSYNHLALYPPLLAAHFMDHLLPWPSQKPLAGVFAMRSEAFHLFYDLKGPTIAFNRGGAIWINLRYYLAWHDAQVKKGDYEPALLSNYVRTLPFIDKLKDRERSSSDFVSSFLSVCLSYLRLLDL